jgi:hypothetical protein
MVAAGNKLVQENVRALAGMIRGFLQINCGCSLATNYAILLDAAKLAS